jgi:hypothetical protein
MNESLDLSIDEETLRVRNRESEHTEFKAIFNSSDIWRYAKTIAAFANRDGGRILFGIKDRPRELIGIDGDMPDNVEIANFMGSYFEPEVFFGMGIQTVYGKNILYIYVRPSEDKPIICKKKKIQQNKTPGQPDKTLLREGAIYFRYSSGTVEIKYPELKNILQNNVKKTFDRLIQNITLIQEAGHDRAVIVDAHELKGRDKKVSVYIAKETAKKLNWIRSGRFSESEDCAEKAFYVIKEVELRHGIEIEKPVDPGKTHTLTKTALMKIVDIGITYIDAVLWKLDMLDNPKYHLSGMHGKNKWHKFTESTIEKTLEQYPVKMEDRKKLIKQAFDEYNKRPRSDHK